MYDEFLRMRMPSEVMLIGFAAYTLILVTVEKTGPKLKNLVNPVLDR